MLDMAKNKKKSLGGRPPLAPADRRSVPVTFRVTPGEHAALERTARDKSISLYSRDLIVSHLKRKGALQ